MRPPHVKAITVGSVAALPTAAGYGVIQNPSVTVTVAVLVGAVALTVARPMWTVHAGLALAVTTLPQLIPYTTQLGSTTVYTYEPFLYTATVYVLYRFRPGAAAWRRVAVLCGLLAVTAAHGFFAGHPTIEIIGDARGLIAVTAALLMSAALSTTAHLPALLRTIRWSLWVSAGFTALGSFTGLPLNGRSESAGLFIDGALQSSDAVRLLTASTHFTLGVLCACLALLITRRTSLKALAPYLVPAMFVTFLGFSRNALLAVAVAVAVALIAERSSLTLAGMARSVGVTVAAAAVVGVLGAMHVPGVDWAALQARAYYDRVLVGGLSENVRNLDSSTLAREQEDRYAAAAIETAPFVGHGLGYAYRSGYGPAESFTATKGRYYVHNFYLWLLVKGGMLGLLAWLYVALLPLVRQVLRPSVRGTALAAAAAGLLAVCFVSPLPNGPESSGAVTMGIVLGALATCNPPGLHRRRPGFPISGGRLRSSSPAADSASA